MCGKSKCLPSALNLYLPICVKLQPTDIYFGTLNPSSNSQVEPSSTVTFIPEKYPGVLSYISPIVKLTNGAIILLSLLL